VCHRCRRCRFLSGCFLSGIVVRRRSRLLELFLSNIVDRKGSYVIVCLCMASESEDVAVCWRLFLCGIAAEDVDF